LRITLQGIPLFRNNIPIHPFAEFNRQRFSKDFQKKFQDKKLEVAAKISIKAQTINLAERVGTSRAEGAPGRIELKKFPQAAVV
jgi:hypothetical protein